MEGDEADSPNKHLVKEVCAMGKNNLFFYLVIGFGLLFVIPAVESVNSNLGPIVTFLVIGYWCWMGLGFLIFLLKNLFAEYELSTLLYNLWLFLSLMCVAVGILALVADGPDKANWAIWMIFYGTTVGYINRKEL